MTAAPKEWMTAAEIAALKLQAVPHTERTINRIVQRENWRESSLARKRSGRGGGWEYHFSLLPQAAVHEVCRLETSLAHDAKGRELAKVASVELTRAQLDAGKLNARQRKIMEARAALLTEIDRRVLCGAGSQAKAIASLLADLAQGDAPVALVDAARVACEGSNGPSRTQVYAWLKARHSMGLIGLAPRLKRQKDPLPDWFEGWLAHYAKPAKPCITSALDDYRKLLADKSLAPTYDQVRRALGKLGPLERAAGREGKLAMRKRLAYVSRDTSDILPTSIYVADGKMYDAEIAHPIHGKPFRPEISSMIDVSTRVCVGWSADLSEKAFAVAEALRHACEGRGIPALFYTDRGPGYISNTMSDPVVGFLSRAGITPMKALPYNAQAKGIMERLNQIYTASAKRFVTYIGADMDREARHLAYKTTRGELKEFGTSKTLPSWQDFLAELSDCIGRYNDTPHSALPKIREGGRQRHLTPNEAWAAKCADGFEPLLPDAAELNEMFRPYVIRVTRRGLIEFNTNAYFCQSLENLDGERVVVGYDNLDPRQVWVRRLERTADGEEPGAFLGIAVFEGNKTRYVPISVERKAMEDRAANRQKRLDFHSEAIDAELRPHRYLDLDANPPQTIAGSVTPLPVAANDPEPVPVGLPPQKPGYHGRPRFDDDVSFAKWLAAHPDQALPRDAGVLRDLLSSANTRDLLRSHGIDLEALKSLARSIA